jgi:microcin C transport system permease protein
MSTYIIRRVLFMIPKIFAILAAVFVIVQFAPGGPVARVIAKLSANNGDTTSVFRVEPY